MTTDKIKPLADALASYQVVTPLYVWVLCVVVLAFALGVAVGADWCGSSELARLKKQIKKLRKKAP